MPSPGAVPLRRRHRAGAVAGRLAVVSGVRRPDAADARAGGARQQPRPAAGGRARRRGARPRGHREVVPLPAGRRRRQLRRAAGVEHGDAGRHANDDTTHQSGAYGFQLSWEIDLFGKLRRQHEAALAVLLASEQARRGVLVTLVGDVASNYFLLRELDLQLDIARQTLRLNDETVTYFQNRLDGGVSNRLELDRIQAIGRRPPPRFRRSSSRSPSSRTRCRCCSAARRRRSRASASPTARPCRRRFRPDCRPR